MQSRLSPYPKALGRLRSTGVDRVVFAQRFFVVGALSVLIHSSHSACPRCHAAVDVLARLFGVLLGAAIGALLQDSHIRERYRKLILLRYVCVQPIVLGALRLLNSCSFLLLLC